MKLLFSQIEEARKNPVRFKRRLAGSRPFFNSKNFRAYFFSAMKRFHLGASKQQVIRYFRQVCTLNLDKQQNFNTRLGKYLQVLSDYCDTFNSQGCTFVEARKRVALPLGVHTLSGTIQRFDLRASGGYRATLTQMEANDWRGELRWPLMQKAVALDMYCQSSEVEIGVFLLETGSYEYKTFTDKEIAAAETEAAKLLSDIEAAAP